LLTLILGAIVMGVGLIFTTLLAPAVTAMVSAGSIAVDIPAGYATYTVMSDAAIPPIYALYYVFQSPVVIALLISLVLMVGLYFLKTKLVMGEKIFVDHEQAGTPAK
jgi:galactitol-specific phosphotransferase system IIC component